MTNFFQLRSISSARSQMWEMLITPCHSDVLSLRCNKVQSEARQFLKDGKLLFLNCSWIQLSAFCVVIKWNSRKHRLLFLFRVSPKQSSEKCMSIEQCHHHSTLQLPPAPGVCYPTLSQSTHTCQSAEMFMAVGFLKFCCSFLTVPCFFWFSHMLLLHNLVSYSHCHFHIPQFNTPHPLSYYPQPWSLTWGNVEFLGVAAFALVVGTEHRSGADREWGGGHLRISPDSWSLSSPDQTKWQESSAKEISSSFSVLQVRRSKNTCLRSADHVNTQLSELIAQTSEFQILIATLLSTK